MLKEGGGEMASLCNLKSKIVCVKWLGKSQEFITVYGGMWHSIRQYNSVSNTHTNLCLTGSGYRL